MGENTMKNTIKTVYDSKTGLPVRKVHVVEYNPDNATKLDKLVSEAFTKFKDECKDIVWTEDQTMESRERKVRLMLDEKLSPIWINHKHISSMFLRPIEKGSKFYYITLEWSTVPNSKTLHSRTGVIYLNNLNPKGGSRFPEFEKLVAEDMD